MEKGFVQREKEEGSEKNESAESSSRLFLACTCNISNMEKETRERETEERKGGKEKQNPERLPAASYYKKILPESKSKNSRNHVMTIEKYFFLHAEYPRLGLFSILFYSIPLIVPYFYSFPNHSSNVWQWICTHGKIIYTLVKVNKREGGRMQVDPW